jgi:hypothetical protein
MMLQLTLPRELEDRLRQEADRLGQSVEAVAVRVLDQCLPPPLDERRSATIAMLHRWKEEDEALTSVVAFAPTRGVNEANSLVVANGRGRDARNTGQLANRVQGAHVPQGSEP